MTFNLGTDRTSDEIEITGSCLGPSTNHELFIHN